MTSSHIVDLSELGSGGWVAHCSCGWISTVTYVRSEALAAARGHAPGTDARDPDHSEIRVPGDGSSAPLPGNAPSKRPRHGREHLRLRSVMERGEAGEVWFRAVCSCGWRSHPIGAGETVILWEQHFDRARGPGQD